MYRGGRGGGAGTNSQRGRGRGGGGRGGRGGGGGGRGEQRWWDPQWRAERLRQMAGEVRLYSTPACRRGWMMFRDASMARLL
jgi:ATP-dependent RNA helicase DHX36